MAAFRVFRLSCGEPLLSKPTTSNFAPDGVLPEKCSAAYCQLLSWFWPTLAKGPDSGSMNAIRIVSPLPAAGAAAALAGAAGLAGVACANARPAPGRARTAATVTCLKANIRRLLSVWNGRRVRLFVHCTAQGMPVSKALAIADVTEGRCARLACAASRA